MAVLTVGKQWVDDIFRVELTTPWVGGEEGTANIQAKQLAARTAFLKDFADEVLAARESEPSLLGRIKKSGVEPLKIMAKFDYISDTPVAASTENVDVGEGGLLTIDGIGLAVGDLVFLKDQADKKQNGFWEAQTGAWNRYVGYTPVDTDCFTYKFIFVKTGEANAGKVFFLDKDVYALGDDELEFRESLFSPKDQPGKVLLRDQEGKSEEDRKRAAAILFLENEFTARGDAIEGWGRNLLDVFRVNTVAEAMAEIRRRCNNNGEIDGSGIPDFRGIMIGDYLDLASLDDGSTVYTWNPDYKNLRILVSGFNTYKGAADTENIKNHVLFTFRNCVLTRQMNTSDTNSGGYASSAMKGYLDGVFALGLKQAIGGGVDYLYPVTRLLSTKGNWAWNLNTVFLPTEYEVWGAPVWSEVGYGGGFQEQYPIFQATVYKGKRHNGSRMWWWLAAPSASSAAHFCLVSGNIYASANGASAAGGVAPAFCVA
jgi:hypothetical protein